MSYPRPRPFPDSDDLGRMKAEAGKAVAARLSPFVPDRRTVPPAIYPQLLGGSAGEVAEKKDAWAKNQAVQTPLWRLYSLGYLCRSAEKYLKDPKRVRSWLTHMEIDPAAAQFAIIAMKLLGEYPGLFLAPTAERFFLAALPSPLKKLRELIELDPAQVLKGEAASHLIFPGMARDRATSRTSPALPRSGESLQAAVARRPYTPPVPESVYEARPADFGTRSFAPSASAPAARAPKRRRVEPTLKRIGEA